MKTVNTKIPNCFHGGLGPLIPLLHPALWEALVKLLHVLLVLIKDYNKEQFLMYLEFYENATI